MLQLLKQTETENCLIKINDSDTTKDFKHSATLRFSTLTSKYGNQILVLSSILLIIALIGINKLTVENRFIDYFKDNTEIYRGMELLDRKLGGTAPLDLIINAPKEIEITEIDVPSHLPNKIPEIIRIAEPKPKRATQITAKIKK